MFEDIEIMLKLVSVFGQVVKFKSVIFFKTSFGYVQRFTGHYEVEITKKKKIIKTF